MTEAQVSIITAAYNAEKYIAETIESVQNQTFLDWEYTIADNGSTDRTAQIVQRYLSDRRIKLINEDHKGKAYARNAAFRNSHGKYIANIDADDLWRVDKLERQVMLLEDHPEVGLVYTGMTIIDARGKTLSVVRPPDISKKPLQYLLAVKNPIVHSSVMIRREAFSEGGYQDENIEKVDEQIVYLRACLAFGKVGFLHEPLTAYRVHTGSEFSNISVRQFRDGYKKGLETFFQIASLPQEIRQLERSASGTMYYLSASAGIHNKKELGLCAFYLFKSIFLRPSKVHLCLFQFFRLLCSPLR